MSKLRILSVVAARPNFMKIAPLCREISKYPDVFEHILVHTGQHYDPLMSQTFFDELAIPAPQVHLEIGSGTHAQQVGRTMMAFEDVLREKKPDWVVVVGDVNATCACALTAAKEHIRLAHIEAGLRSFDRTMPEEINRIVTDRLADLLFTTDEEADRNLRNEGVCPDIIRRVGNIMIDTLEHNRKAADSLDVREIITKNFSGTSAPDATPDLKKNGFAVLTLHRPSNVDVRSTIEPLVAYFIEELSREMPILWTLHPRTAKQLETFGLWNRILACPRIIPLRPVGYREMLCLNSSARLMLTDSGGLQEECCVLGTPCVTLRENTERPVTLMKNGGLSVLTGNDVNRIRTAVAEMKSSERRICRPPLWDGRTAERITQVFIQRAKG